MPYPTSSKHRRNAFRENGPPKSGTQRPGLGYNAAMAPAKDKMSKGIYIMAKVGTRSKLVSVEPLGYYSGDKIIPWHEVRKILVVPRRGHRAIDIRNWMWGVPSGKQIFLCWKDCTTQEIFKVISEAYQWSGPIAKPLTSRKPLKESIGACIPFDYEANETRQILENEYNTEFKLRTKLAEYAASRYRENLPPMLKKTQSVNRELLHKIFRTSSMNYLISMVEDSTLKANNVLHFITETEHQYVCGCKLVRYSADVRLDATEFLCGHLECPREGCGISRITNAVWFNRD